MASDLREQLIAAKFRHIDEEGAEWDAVEIADAILVVAAWLRDKAATSRRIAEKIGSQSEALRAVEYELLADEIDPPTVAVRDASA